MGLLCVLDTRPRQITEKQKEMLHWIAEVVTTAIELKNATPRLDRLPAKAQISSLFTSHQRSAIVRSLWQYCFKDCPLSYRGWYPRPL